MWVQRYRHRTLRMCLSFSRPSFLIVRSGNNQHRSVSRQQALLESLPSPHDVKPPPFSPNPPVFMAGYLWPWDQQECRSPRCSHFHWLLHGFQPFYSFKPWCSHFENVTFGGYRYHLRRGGGRRSSQRQRDFVLCVPVFFPLSLSVP